MSKINTKQSGATLFIGLMLLLAISIVSLAAMRSSILELVMTNNKQQFSYAFEAAELVVSQRFDDVDFVIDPQLNADDVVPDSVVNNQTITAPDNNGVVRDVAWVNSAIRYRSQGPAEGWSLENSATAFHYQLDAQSSTNPPGTNANQAGRGAAANHRIGFYRVVPAI